MSGRLRADQMLARAETETGLSDYGDPTLPQRFGLVVDHLNTLAMDEAGCRRAEDVCHVLLTSRLQFFEDRNRYPIADEVVERPMFVTGEPRSGTTLMHALMSVDPDARALRFWEVMYPSPPPGIADADDPRRARADEDWREINVQMPKWLHLDQANRKPEVLRHLQGALAITRLGEAEQKTVLVVPRRGESIQSFRDRYLAAFPTDPNEGKSLDAERGEWLKHTIEQKRWLLANGRVVAPKLEPGDMLVWSSGVSHASAPGPLPPDQTERGMRITSFVSAIPKALCSEADIKKRQEILELGRTSGHRVLEPSLKITKDADGKPVYHESTTRFRQCVFDKKGRIYPGGGDDELPEYKTDRVLSGFAEPGDCPLKQGMARFCGGY